MKIWYSSHVPYTNFDNPNKYGWTNENNIWTPIFSTQDPVPHEIRNILVLHCSDATCTSKKCKCVSQGLKCYEECNCKFCSNKDVIGTAESLDEDF